MSVDKIFSGSNICLDYSSVFNSDCCGINTHTSNYQHSSDHNCRHDCKWNHESHRFYTSIFVSHIWGFVTIHKFLIRLILFMFCSIVILDQFQNLTQLVM